MPQIIKATEPDVSDADPIVAYKAVEGGVVGAYKTVEKGAVMPIIRWRISSSARRVKQWKKPRTA